MRVCGALMGLAGLACVTVSGLPAAAQAPSPSTPATPGPNPGAAARDAVTSPAKPPGDMAPPVGGAAPSGRVEYSAPAAPAAAGSNDMREAIAQLREIAKGTRENVDYSRVVPDILTQILAKLDKLEDKLDKVENAVKAGQRRR